MPSATNTAMAFPQKYMYKRNTHLRHPPVHHEIRPVDKTALVAREPEHGVRLLDRFAEPACGEMDFASEAFGAVVA